MDNPKHKSPPSIFLKKGELLFSEGESSKAMYLVRTGAVRLFLSRKDSVVEIATARSGEIIGELAFLDGNPRSASAEALTGSDLVEISSNLFHEVLNNTPQWLKILLKTVVGRVRSANTRIRQMETRLAKGKGGHTYQYLTIPEFMKILTATIVLTASYKVPSKEESPQEGIPVDMERLGFYSYDVMGVPIAKIYGAIDILAQAGAMKTKEEKGLMTAHLQEKEFLEELLHFLHREREKDPSAKKDLSVRGFLILDIIVDEAAKKSPGATGVVSLDVGSARKKYAEKGDPKTFKNEDVAELFNLGYISEVNIRSEEEVLVTFDRQHVLKSHRLLKVMMGVKMLNEQKRKLAGISK